MALANINDLMDITGESYTDDQVWRLTTLLGNASRAIQVYTGQKIARQTHIWRPKVAWTLHIPQMPDVEITSVQNSNSQDVTYTFDGYDTIWLTNPIFASFEVDPILPISLNRLIVTYVAGYDFIPEDIKNICVQMAMRAYGSDPAKSGYTQEAVTNYSYQQGQAAASGAIGMLPIEMQALLKYKRHFGPIPVNRV